MDMKKDISERRLYEMPLAKGWNLISFPGTPANPVVAEVFRSTPSVDMVHSFRNEEWLTAVRAVKSWKGRLAEVAAGCGYWVHAEAAETLATPIAKLPAEPPAQSVVVDYGWNLLGVLDVEQGPAGEPPAKGSGDADEYFSNLDWQVAYSFEGIGVWKKALPGQDTRGFICNGKGYWVWVESPGVFTPFGERRNAAAGVAS